MANGWAAAKPGIRERRSTRAGLRGMGLVSSELLPSRFTTCTWAPKPISLPVISLRKPEITAIETIITAMPMPTVREAMRTMTPRPAPPFEAAIRRAMKSSVPILDILREER